MKHAGATTLAELSELLRQLRAVPGLVERKPGIFYRGPSAFLHFHEDPAGIFADAKLSGRDFERLPVSTPQERRAFLLAVRSTVESSARPSRAHAK